MPVTGYRLLELLLSSMNGSREPSRLSREGYFSLPQGSE